MWRFSYDSVRHSLAANKPQVATKESITLKKGVFARVLWLPSSMRLAVATASTDVSASAAEATLPIQAA